MGSNLATIVNAISALPIQYDGKTIDIRIGSTLPETPSIADLPMRMISAMQSSGGQVKRLTLGSNPVINFRWQITDILLGQQVGLNRGIKSQSGALFTYASTYAQQIRSLVTNTWQIEDVAISVDVLELPSESGNYYYGVRCDLTVKEIVQGA